MASEGGPSPARRRPGGLARALAFAALLAGCGDDERARSPEPGTGPEEPSGGMSPAPSGADSLIKINELMARNALTLKADDTGVAVPWVELYNGSDEDVPISGYAFTDDLAAPTKGPIGDGVVIPAQGRVVLWLDNDPAAGPTHVGATLFKAGVLGFARPDGTFIDRVSYGAQSPDLSAAREPDGSDNWVIEWYPTPGEPNADGPGAPLGAEAPADPPELVPAAGDLTDEILGYDRMPELALTIAGGDMAALRSSPRVYVPAMLSYRGRDYGPVGVKLKGQESFEPIDAKPSLHINIDEYAPEAAFFGLKDITLNNMHGDYSMMHERIAYWVARNAGVPASRANHALLTVNGRFYGLYNNVETVKKRMMGQLFGDDNGTLFSTQDVDFVPQDVPDFTVESGPDDRRLLAGLADALTASSPDAAMAGAANYADIDEFTRYWAVCAVVGQFDAFPYSNPGDDYFLYANPVTQKLVFMPWGIDETFYSSELDVVARVSSVMAQKCEASPACFQKFVSQTMDVLALVERLDWAAEHARVAAQIAPYTVMDTNKWYSDADVAKYQRSMSSFVGSRRAHLAPMLRAR